MYERFYKEIEKAAAKFKSWDKSKTIRLISHLDADGISAAAVIIHLLNQENRKYTISILPQLDRETIQKLAHLIRAYFRMGSHHVQFNVVSSDLLHEAQKHPKEFQDLMVRVAGYSDYFVNLSEGLQNEIIARTEHKQ